MLHLVGDEGFVLTPGHFQLRLGACFFVGAATRSRCWVDNTSAEHALNKGYSKDLRLSALIGAFWVWAASMLSVSFHRVPSSENISLGISRGDLSE